MRDSAEDAARAPAPASRRPREERVALALPAPARRLALASLSRLAPGSELRRRLLKRLIVRSLDADARGAFDFGLLLYEPDVQLRVRGGVAQALSLAEDYHGHDGVRQVWRDYRRDMDSFHAEPEQIIDLGDRVALRVTLVGTGRTSGATVRHTEGFVICLSPRGLIARQEIYWSWDEALAGLQAGAIVTA